MSSRIVGFAVGRSSASNSRFHGSSARIGDAQPSNQAAPESGSIHVFVNRCSAAWC